MKRHGGDEPAGIEVGGLHSCGGRWRQLYQRGPAPEQKFVPAGALKCSKCGAVQRLSPIPKASK